MQLQQPVPRSLAAWIVVATVHIVILSCATQPVRRCGSASQLDANHSASSGCVEPTGRSALRVVRVGVVGEHEELATSSSTRPLAIALTGSHVHVAAGLSPRDASISGQANWLLRVEKQPSAGTTARRLRPPMPSNASFGWVRVGNEPRIWRGTVGESVLELVRDDVQSQATEAFPGFAGILGIKPGTTEVVDHAGQVFWAVGYVPGRGSVNWTPTVARWSLSGPPGKGTAMSSAIASWSFPLLTAWADGAVITANHASAEPNAAGAGLWLGHVDNELAVVTARDVGLKDATLPNAIVRVAGGDLVVAFRSNGKGVAGARPVGGLPGLVRLDAALNVRWVQRWPQQSLSREWMALAGDQDDAVLAYFETGRHPRDPAAGRAILRLTRAALGGAGAQHVALDLPHDDSLASTAVAVAVTASSRQPVLALWYSRALHFAVIEAVPPSAKP